MSEQDHNQESVAEIIKWGEELDELDHLAFAGKPVSN
jgi:hypothetical protein